jgi:DnaK suppressor protein
MDTRTKNRLRRLLQDELRQRGRLLGEIRRSIAERGAQLTGSRHSLSSHMAEDATEEADRDSDYIICGAQGRELQEIEEALRRLDQGIYGICEDCGEQIEERRLAVVPSARFCFRCKQLQERLLQAN